MNSLDMTSRKFTAVAGKFRTQKDRAADSGSTQSASTKVSPASHPVIPAQCSVHMPAHNDATVQDGFVNSVGMGLNFDATR